MADIAGDEERRVRHHVAALAATLQHFVDDDDVMFEVSGLLLDGDGAILQRGCGYDIHVGGTVGDLEEVFVQRFDACAGPCLGERRVGLCDGIAACGHDVIACGEGCGFGQTVFGQVAEADERRVQFGGGVGWNGGAQWGDPNVAGLVGTRARLRECHVCGRLLRAHVNSFRSLTFDGRRYCRPCV